MESGERNSMATCETCGNSYDKSFRITMAGAARTFDSFECAITSLEPASSHCGRKIPGPGVEAGGAMYCSVYCARKSDVKELRDRA